jgi:lipid-A-disaccharide synthase-like uncharacterized protein
MDKFWLVMGFSAQFLFASRFLVQWIASERVGHSIVPVGFWLFSISGGVLLLLYAIWRKDPVFIVGQGTGLFIYLRNLFMIIRDRKRENKKIFRLSDLLNS